MTSAVQLYEQPEGGAVTQLQFNRQQLDLLKATVAKGTTDDQFSLFCEVAQRTGLNPFAKQIYAVVRKGQDGPTMTIQTGVDGYRLIAQRTGEYAGQRGPQWCGDDGEWRDVWLAKEAPAAARVGVFRSGFVEPVWGIATLKSYQQTDRDGKPSGLWKTMPDVMIAKCAEVLALRKAFPQELSGLYADSEMEQADSEPMDRAPKPANQRPPRSSQRAPRTDVTEDGELIDGEVVNEKPVWTSKALSAALEAATISMAHLAPVLGEAPTKDNTAQLIDAWFFANPGKTEKDLVAAAVQAQIDGASQETPQAALMT